ncbi:acyl-CoA synthetase [Methylomonas sp. LL1]|nr:acyl-CoA synthetase [Methylomonas sp. LL1]
MRPTEHLPFAVYRGRVVSRGNFWADVKELAACLPDRPYLFNLCENRYLFCLCLLAAAVRGQVCLLPPSNQLAVVREILADYPDAYLVSEQDPGLPDLAWFGPKQPRSEDIAEEAAIDWPRGRLIAFTSGSTGKPKPCVHSLETFRVSAEMAVRSLGLERQTLLMLSTTPPQHMYGLETSVFWPLFSNLILHDTKPFFPEDARHTVETAAWPTMLLTTPTHLRSLVKTSGPWLNLAGVISATDTLSEKLAAETGAILGQYPREIYGSTETLSFASRQTRSENPWTPYAGSRLVLDHSGHTYLESPHLPVPALLQDRMRINADGGFEVLGRRRDMVKIGGKRASLAELNRRLKDIDGVEDGFCFIQGDGPGEGRLAAVVVSRLDKQTIRLALQPYLDQVFLPRKILYVDAIPRNQAGKLLNSEMEKLLAGLV